MKNYILGLLAATALTTAAVSAASAADLPSRRYAPAPIVAAVPVFTWTGFYVGVNAGYGWNTNDNDVFVPGIGVVDSDDDGGFVGGAQVGYNYQIGSFVVGLEGDIQYADFGGDNDVVGFDDDNNDWFGTVRARAGFAIDRVLIYATGGFAYAGGDGDNCGGFSGGTFRCDGGDDTRWGYAVGAGFEWAMPMAAGLFGSSAVTFGVEALYVNLDQDDNNRNSFFNPTTNTVFLGTRHDDDDFGIVRAKVNFKF